MLIYKLPNAAASKVTVTSTATSLLSLIDTAAGEAANLSGRLNAVDILAEDGDVRFLVDGNTPTAAEGELIRNGERMFLRGVPVSKLQLIRSGDADVAVSVRVGECEVDESSSSSIASSSAGGGETVTPTNPTVDSPGLQTAAIDVAASQTDSSLISAPGAGKQIWVYGMTITTDADGTVLLESGSTALTGTLPIAANGGFSASLSGDFRMPWLKCGTNEAFTLTNGAGTIDGVVQYAIITV